MTIKQMLTEAKYPFRGGWATFEDIRKTLKSEGVGDLAIALWLRATGLLAQARPPMEIK